jgi:anaerobic selenocysteine-containing dehydrogenase
MAASMFDLDVDKGHDAVLAKSGLDVAKLRAAPAGIKIDGNVRLDAYAALVEGHPRGFPTPTKKIEIYSEQLLETGYRPVPAFDPADLLAADNAYPLQLGSAKSIAYCHSQHRNLKSLRRLAPDPTVEMSSADAAARSIVQGEWVRIRTRAGNAVAKAVIVSGLAPGAVFGQHGWWVPGDDGTPYDATKPLAANINNAIATDRADPVSGSIPLRCFTCEIEKVDG